MYLMGYGSKKRNDVEQDPLIENDVERITAEAPHQGRTLLPGPAASLVSGITGLSSFYVRAGTKIGGWGLYAGREATLKTLSMSNSVLQALLTVAGQDIYSRSDGELGRADAETLLERSVSFSWLWISTLF